MQVIELSAGPDRVLIDPEAGVRLTSLVAGGRERLVDAPARSEDRLSTLWGCFPIVPWAGRIATARFRWEGATHELRRNNGEHSIHGVAFDRAWEVIDARERNASLALDTLIGWPFAARASHEIALAQGSLALDLRLTASDEAMPAWIGWHPWFRRPEAGDMTVRVGSSGVLETSADLIPTGRVVDLDPETDLRAGPRLGRRRLDHVYIETTSPAEITWPDLKLTMEFELPIRTLVVHTPEHGVCVEPQTGWPDAISLEREGIVMTGLRRLLPGETIAARTTWRWS